MCTKIPINSGSFGCTEDRRLENNITDSNTRYEFPPDHRYGLKIPKILLTVSSDTYPFLTIKWITTIHSKVHYHTIHFNLIPRKEAATHSAHESCINRLPITKAELHYFLRNVKLNQCTSLSGRCPTSQCIHQGEF